MGFQIYSNGPSDFIKCEEYHYYCGITGFSKVSLAQ